MATHSTFTRTPRSSVATSRNRRAEMRPDILIIGGGPSAMTAALYSLRAGKKVLLLEKENFGGQIADSPRVENFPSQKVISGLDFSSTLFDQISSLGAQYELDEAKSI